MPEQAYPPMFFSRLAIAALYFVLALAIGNLALTRRRAWILGQMIFPLYLSLAYLNMAVLTYKSLPIAPVVPWLHAGHVGLILWLIHVFILHARHLSRGDKNGSAP